MTRLLLSPLFALGLAACAASHHPTTTSGLGAASRASDMLARLPEPGPIEALSIVSADWQVARSGLVNLAHPEARRAGLKDGDEPIQIFFHVLRHPTRGTFIIDTGVERALRDAPDQAAIRGVVARAMKLDTMRVHMPLGDWLAQQPRPIAGVLLSHLHIDHVSGMPDVPRGTPIFAGPGETTMTAATNPIVRPNIDRALAGHAAIAQWRFAPDPDGRFEGVLDVLGDGSLWAIWTPGHTAGSTAYLARTTEGPVLFAGDTCHTAWGWDHDVEPGKFTADHRRNADSLARLRRLAREFPALRVRLGHQHPSASGEAR